MELNLSLNSKGLHFSKNLGKFNNQFTFLSIPYSQDLKLTTQINVMLTPKYRQKLGRLGEKLACQFLQKKGYQLIRQNFLIRGGQIDLIMFSPQHNLVFVEVKTRSSVAPSQEILLSYHQLQTLQKTAGHFLQQIDFPFAAWQLDLIWINFDQFNSPIPHAKIKHYQNILEI